MTLHYCIERFRKSFKKTLHLIKSLGRRSCLVFCESVQVQIIPWWTSLRINCDISLPWTDHSLKCYTNIILRPIIILYTAIEYKPFFADWCPIVTVSKFRFRFVYGSKDAIYGNLIGRLFYSKKSICSKRHSSFVVDTFWSSPELSSDSFFLDWKNRRGNMPNRHPIVTPSARPPLAAILEEDISNCSIVSGGGLPHPSLASQYSTYQADLK